MTRLEDIHPGNLLTGRVSNVTAFGAFVDIGEQKNVYFKLSFQFHVFYDTLNTLYVFRYWQRRPYSYQQDEGKKSGVGEQVLFEI